MDLTKQRKDVLKHVRGIRSAVLKTYDVKKASNDVEYLYTRKGKSLGKMSPPSGVSSRIVPPVMACYIMAAKIALKRDRNVNKEGLTTKLVNFHTAYQEYIGEEMNRTAQELAEVIQSVFFGMKIDNKGFSRKDMFTKITLFGSRGERLDIMCARELKSTDPLLTFQYLVGEIGHRVVEHPEDETIKKVYEIVPAIGAALHQYAVTTEILVDIGPIPYSEAAIIRMRKLAELTS